METLLSDCARLLLLGHGAALLLLSDGARFASAKRRRALLKLSVGTCFYGCVTEHVAATGRVVLLLLSDGARCCHGATVP